MFPILVRVRNVVYVYDPFVEKEQDSRLTQIRSLYSRTMRKLVSRS